MPARPIHCERSAPVMANQDDILRHAELLKQRVNETTVLQEAVTVRISTFQLFRVPHANQVWRDAAGLRRYVWHDITPEIGGGRIAVEEDNRRTAAELSISHPFAVHFAELLRRLFTGIHVLDLLLRYLGRPGP